MISMSRPIITTHPLADFVMEQFCKQDIHDVTTIAVAMCGDAVLSPFDAPSFDDDEASGIAAYRLVASDVLRAMEQRGVIVKDIDGWYRLSAPPDMN